MVSTVSAIGVSVIGVSVIGLPYALPGGKKGSGVELSGKKREWRAQDSRRLQRRSGRPEHRAGNSYRNREGAGEVRHERAFKRGRRY